MSSLWINLRSTDKVFSQFYERGREHWEAAVIKLGTQMQIWASWHGAVNWGTLWTQKNIQRPFIHPIANTGSSVRCLQLTGTSETPKGEVLLIFFSTSKGNVHWIVTCQCQDCTLKLYSCLCWEVQRVFSYRPHLSFPRHDEDKKLPCKWLVPHTNLQSAFTAAEMMCKRRQQRYTCSLSPLRKGMRDL